MKEAGQFLISPSMFLGAPTDYVYVGISLAAAAVLLIWHTLRFRISRETTLFFYRGLLASSLLSIPVTYAMTYMGMFTYSTAQPLVDFMGSLDLSHISQYTRHLPGPMAQFFHSRTGQKVSAIPIGIAVLLLTLFVVGAGYAFTEIKLSLFSQFLAMSTGVGLPEEVAKSFVGLLMVLWVAKSKGVYDQKIHQSVCSSFSSPYLVFLGCFTASGLGFGMGEALKYFEYYSRHDLGLYAFFLRALWCVPLHGAWTMLSGACLYAYGGDGRSFSELASLGKLNLFSLLVGVSIPAALAHGLYNALALENSIWMFIVGATSLLVVGALLYSASNVGQPSIPRKSET